MGQRHNKIAAIVLILVMLTTSVNITAFAAEAPEMMRSYAGYAKEQAATYETPDTYNARNNSSEITTLDLFFEGNFDYDKSFEVLSLVNKERAKKGLRPLTMDTQLLEAAMQRAAENAVMFGHTRPDGSSWSTIFDLSTGGENVAYGQKTASQVMNVWMNSEGHRSNILTADYNSVGIGCFYQPGGQIYWVQLFNSDSASDVAVNIHNVIRYAWVCTAIENTYVYTKDKSLTLKADESKTLELYCKNLEAGNSAPLKLAWDSAYYFTDDYDVAYADGHGAITGISKGNTKAYAVLAQTEEEMFYLTVSVDVTSSGGVQPSDYSYRLYGSSRYDTAIEIAYAMQSGRDEWMWDSIIVADGTGYADALSGAYLSKVKDAPILVVGKDQTSQSKVRGYINDNLSQDGTIYILGGEGAVTKEFADSVSQFNVKRLGGSNRYETNLTILTEAGVTDEDMLICSGTGFADSLSASAVGKPIMLVGDSLTPAQKTFLGKTKKRTNYIIGGTGAVCPQVENQLKGYGNVERVFGSNRYTTSTEVASKFFPSDECPGMVLAYGLNFPDGLAGGPLAMMANAPLVLVSSGDTAAAAEYAEKTNITEAVVLGGPGLISDKAVKTIIE